jgi:hypothetical protein
MQSMSCQVLPLIRLGEGAQAICGIGDRKPRLRTLDLARNPIPSDTGSSCLSTRAYIPCGIKASHARQNSIISWGDPNDTRM